MSLLNETDNRPAILAGAVQFSMKKATKTTIKPSTPQQIDVYVKPGISLLPCHTKVTSNGNIQFSNSGLLDGNVRTEIEAKRDKNKINSYQWIQQKSESGLLDGNVQIRIAKTKLIMSTNAMETNSMIAIAILQTEYPYCIWNSRIAVAVAYECSDSGLLDGNVRIRGTVTTAAATNKNNNNASFKGTTATW